jgi:hypothetical protein
MVLRQAEKGACWGYPFIQTMLRVDDITSIKRTAQGVIKFRLTTLGLVRRVFGKRYGHMAFATHGDAALI